MCVCVVSLCLRCSNQNVCACWRSTSWEDFDGQIDLTPGDTEENEQLLLTEAHEKHVTDKPVSYRCWICLLLLYVLATSNVILGPTCDSAHSWWFHSAGPLGNQTARYLTQSHYPNTDPTSPCSILIMPSTLLESDKYQWKIIGLLVSLKRGSTLSGPNPLLSQNRRRKLYSSSHPISS